MLLARRARPAKEHVLDVLASAGTAVLAFQIDDEQEISPFRISIWIARKEGNRFVRLSGMRAGVFRRAGKTPILSETAGAGGEIINFSKGLIAWPA